MSKKYLSMAMAATIIVGLSSRPAVAGCCGEVAAIGAASAANSAAITLSTTAIVTAIAAASDVGNAQQTQVQGEIADNQHNRRVGLSNAENAGKARQDYGVLPPKVCDSLASASAGMIARESSARTTERIGANLNRRGMSTPYPGAAVRVIFDNHRLKYCSEESAAKGRCKTISKLPNGDIEPRSLLTGAGPAGKVSYTFDDQQVAAGQDYLNNIIQPVTRQQLSAKEEQTETGQGYTALRLAEQAKYNLAALPGSEALAWRAPVRVNGLPLGQHLKDMWQKMGGVSVPQDVQEQLAKSNNEASYYFFQQTEIDRRVNNPGWYQDMLAAPQATLLRELTYIQAQQSAALFDLQKQIERTNLLLGGIYAEQIRQPHNDQMLVAQHRQAVGDGGPQKK